MAEGKLELCVISAKSNGDTRASILKLEIVTACAIETEKYPIETHRRHGIMLSH